MAKLKYEDNVIKGIDTRYLEDNKIKYRIDVTEELIKAAFWLSTHDHKKYKNLDLFMNNWFRRAASKQTTTFTGPEKVEDFFS